MSAYDRAVKQMQDTGQIRYETMRELLGLTPGYKILGYRLARLWEAFSADVCRAFEGSKTQNRYGLAGEK